MMPSDDVCDMSAVLSVLNTPPNLQTTEAIATKLNAKPSVVTAHLYALRDDGLVVMLGGLHERWCLPFTSTPTPKKKTTQKKNTIVKDIKKPNTEFLQDMNRLQQYNTRGSFYERRQARIQHHKDVRSKRKKRQLEEKRANALARWKEKYGKPVMMTDKQNERN